MLETVGDTQLDNDKRVIGCVKWFNNKSGYGFVTAIKGDSTIVGKDIFVHHSSIITKNDLYKYLVQGEYVEFNIEKVHSNNDHEHQAKHITGISQGPLLCESRLLNKDNIKVRDRTSNKKRFSNNSRSVEEN